MLSNRNKQRSRTVWAVVLIGVGAVFLLVNAGLFSFGDIGQFFGSIGRAFGELGRGLGQFFGDFGWSIGRLWPLALILIGMALLFWRKPTVPKSKNDEQG